MCELRALFLNSEKEPVKIYRWIKRGKWGEDYFYKSSECINSAVEWSGDLSKFIAQVDTGEPLFKKLGMIIAGK